MQQPSEVYSQSMYQSDGRSKLPSIVGQQKVIRKEMGVPGYNSVSPNGPPVKGVKNRHSRNANGIDQSADFERHETNREYTVMGPAL
jgi:hypothetical protein